MEILAAIWKNYDETPESFREATSRIDGVQFETVLPGGFGAGSFTVPVGGWNAIRWYRDYVGHHVVLYDHLGRRIYEGRIVSTNADGTGVNVVTEGYYAHGNDLTHGIVYPISVPKSISDIVKDTIALATQWSQDTSMIQTTTTDVTPQDFTGDKKLIDAIETVLKTGDDSTIPIPLHFAIWENRRAYLFSEPQLEVLPSWMAYTKDFADGKGMALSRSRQDLFNKIQVLFDDPDIGQTFTDWFQDAVSQALFGTREGTMNIGSSVSGIANLVGELALKAYSKPTQSSSFGVSGRIYTWSGAQDFPYMVRAGSLIGVNDFDPTVSQLVDGSSGADSSVAFISRTHYDASSNTVELELGRKNIALDILLARLGMSSGSIR